MKKDEKTYINNALVNMACNYIRNYNMLKVNEIIKTIDNQKMLDSFKTLLNRDITYNEFLELLRIFKRSIKNNYDIEVKRCEVFKAV